jgi:hypothetical protein
MVMMVVSFDRRIDNSDEGVLMPMIDGEWKIHQEWR